MLSRHRKGRYVTLMVANGLDNDGMHYGQKAFPHSLGIHRATVAAQVAASSARGV